MSEISITVSGGVGPQGAAGSSATQTVINGLTGTITIVGSGISVAAAGTTITLTSTAPVSSVNAKTGVVVLSAADVTAASAVHAHHADDITAGTINRDRLPVATTKAIGAVQASVGLSVDANGHLSANVQSVAGRTGDVTLATTDIANFSVAAAAAAPVQSVNGKTGAVSLAAVDVTAAAASHQHAASDITSGTLSTARLPTISYTSLSNVPATFTPATHTHDASAIQAGTMATARLPIATATAVGVVSVTSGLSVTAGGALSANVRSVAGRTGDVTLTAADVTAAAASHQHAASDITSGTLANAHLTARARRAINLYHYSSFR